MSGKEIPERDKPFYLALVSSFITIFSIVIAAVGALYNNEQMVETGKEALKFTFPLTTMAWTFYYKSRS